VDPSREEPGSIATDTQLQSSPYGLRRGDGTALRPRPELAAAYWALAIPSERGVSRQTTVMCGSCYQLTDETNHLMKSPPGQAFPLTRALMSVGSAY
jgi:hypothetical protein